MTQKNIIGTFNPADCGNKIYNIKNQLIEAIGSLIDKYGKDDIEGHKGIRIKAEHHYEMIFGSPVEDAWGYDTRDTGLVTDVFRHYDGRVCVILTHKDKTSSCWDANAIQIEGLYRIFSRLSQLSNANRRAKS